jgi:hypothetical protein
VLTTAVQFGGGRLHPGAGGLVISVALILFVVALGAAMGPALNLAVSGARGAVRSWRSRRRRLRTAADAEARARALMSELCPHGWRAQITLFSAADPDDHRPLTPHGERALVALDWAELGEDGARPVVMRRVWARTIGEAFEAMVADRRTDETLEEIERGAVADGVLWPDS